MNMVNRNVAPKAAAIEKIEFLKVAKAQLDNGIPVHLQQHASA